MIIRTSTPVVILQYPSMVLHTGALGIARSLGRMGVAVHGIGLHPASPVAHSRYLHTALPLPRDARDDDVLERLYSLRLGEPAVLVPIDDIGALLVEENAEELRSRFLLPEQPRGLAHTLSDKRSMTRLASAAGIPVPTTYFPSSSDEVDQILRRCTFPVVLKAGDTRALHANPSTASVAILPSAQDVRHHVELLTVDGVPNAILQEYIPGGPETIWMVNAYFDSRSECRFAAAGRKLRQWPPYSGATTLGVTERNAEVLDSASAFLRDIGYRGIVDMGFRYDARDGAYKLLDVNPRIGATFRLFTASDGLDVLRCLYLDLTAQDIPAAAVPEQRKWLVENRDLAASLLYARDGRLTPTQYGRSLRGIQESAWYARDDPAPVAHMTAASFRSAASRGRDRLLSRAKDSAPEDPQAPTSDHFHRNARFWRDVYDDPGVFAAIHRERRARALRIVDGLDLPAGSPALEIGCGAGSTAVALAHRGLAVDATDAVPTMVELTRTSVQQAGAAGVRCWTTDAHALGVADGTYELIVALGVLPWLHTPRRALAEMARALRPGGYLVLGADNRSRLTYLLDPRFAQALAGPRRVVSRVRRAVRGAPATAGAPVTMMTHAELDRLVRGAGLHPEEVQAIGFGPFTLLGREVLTDTPAVAVHRWLQTAADRHRPVLRSTANQYLLLARKPAP